MIWMLQVETYLWAHTAPSSVWKGACDEAVPLAPGPKWSAPAPENSTWVM